METLFIIVVTGFVVYGIYHVWYVPRETMKKSGGSRLSGFLKQDKK